MWSPPTAPVNGSVPPHTSIPCSFGTSPGWGSRYFAMPSKLSNSPTSCRNRPLTSPTAIVGSCSKMHPSLSVMNSLPLHDTGSCSSGSSSPLPGRIASTTRGCPNGRVWFCVGYNPFYQSTAWPPLCRECRQPVTFVGAGGNNDVARYGVPGARARTVDLDPEQRSLDAHRLVTRPYGGFDGE